MSPIRQVAEKNKKSRRKQKMKKRVLALMLGAILALSLCACGGDTTDPTANMTPEEIKATADANDLEIARSVWSAKQYVTRFEEEIQAMGTGGNSLSDVYEYAGDAEDFLLELSSRVDAVEMSGDIAETYRDNASGYIATVGVISMDIQDFIDTSDQGKLSSIKQNLSILPEAENMVNESRTAYLKDAGFTDEEIASRPQVDDNSEQ